MDEVELRCASFPGLRRKRHSLIDVHLTRDTPLGPFSSRCPVLDEGAVGHRATGRLQIEVEFEQEWDTFVNGMSVYQELTSSLQWQDGDASYDVLDGYRGVLVPNSGEVRYDLHFEGVSMEASGVWFSVETATGAEELLCDDDVTLSLYTAAEQAYIPYTCSTTSVSSPIWDTTTQTSASGEVTGVRLTSLMADQNAGDTADLFRYSVWVR